MSKIDVKIETSICRIIRQHLSEKQIEENYQAACKKILPPGCMYAHDLMENVTLECRKMALNKIPKRAFNMMQIIYIRNEWKIDI